MDVAALQKHLSDLATFLQKAGASQTVIGGVQASAGALAPFAAYKIDQFAAFLKIADDYRRAGLTPDKVPGRTAPKAETTTVIEGPAAEAINRIAKLYQDILNPGFTPDYIEQELGQLKGLKKPELLAAADRIGIKALVNSLNVAPMRDAIKKAIRDRRGMHNRPNY